MFFKLVFVPFAATALAHSHTSLDPVCPKGFHSGVQINDFQFDQPFHKFYERTKSFFDISWYGGGHANSTSGTDNTPGAIREGTFTGKFKEELIAYYSDETSLYQKYIGLIPQEITIPAKPEEQLLYVSYTEHYGFDSSCGGKATTLQMMVVFCANDPVAVADAWNAFRQSSIQALANELHAVTFVGNCPTSY